MAARPVAVVTGATGGIGRWIALGLAQAGHHVVLVGRDAGRGEAAQEWIGARAAEASTTLLLADLSSLAATRALAVEIVARHPKLAVLVNNAGVFEAKRRETPEGHEMVLAVNHLSPFLLTRDLLPALRAGAPARIVTVGSSISDRAWINPDNLELRRGWNLLRAYGQSKLAVMMTTFTYASQLQNSGITANVVHPGAVATGLVKTPGIIGLAWRLMAPWLLNETQGAATPLRAALAPDLAGTTGAYLTPRGLKRPNRRALDAGLCARVWRETERLVEG